MSTMIPVEGGYEVELWFDPLRGYAWLYQCNQCWSVIHKRHLDDHRRWHSMLLHIPHDGVR